MSDERASGTDSPATPRPAPVTTELSQGFWDAVARRELAVQQCSQCETLRHYPQPFCPQCHSRDFAWTRVCGRGQIHSYTVAHRAFHPAWKDHVPYVIATIELEEGIRMVSDMLDTNPETVAIGQAVEVRFEELPGQGLMPRFEVVG